MTRFFDVVFSILGILILSPIFIIVYLLIIVDSPGGGIYRQERIGKDGIPFSLYKFRSMQVGSAKSGLITVGGHDPRITKVGYFIRKYKIDELPQLFNVVMGNMSLVGPRPEVSRYVDLYTPEQRKVLSVRPGITDYASIEYVDENERLSSTDFPEEVYINEILPDKIRYNMRYINNKSLAEYFKIIIFTALRVVRRRI